MQVVSQLDSLKHWDSFNDQWTLPGLQFAGNNIPRLDAQVPAVQICSDRHISSSTVYLLWLHFRRLHFFIPYRIPLARFFLKRRSRQAIPGFGLFGMGLGGGLMQGGQGVGGGITGQGFDSASFHPEMTPEMRARLARRMLQPGKTQGAKC